MTKAHMNPLIISTSSVELGHQALVNPKPCFICMDLFLESYVLNFLNTVYMYVLQPNAMTHLYLSLQILMPVCMLPLVCLLEKKNLYLIFCTSKNGDIISYERYVINIQCNVDYNIHSKPDMYKWFIFTPSKTNSLIFLLKQKFQLWDDFLVRKWTFEY